MSHGPINLAACNIGEAMQCFLIIRHHSLLLSETQASHSRITYRPLPDPAPYPCTITICSARRIPCNPVPPQLSSTSNRDASLANIFLFCRLHYHSSLLSRSQNPRLINLYAILHLLTNAGREKRPHSSFH
jgi:hypothetical protein